MIPNLLTYLISSSIKASLIIGLLCFFRRFLIKHVSSNCLHKLWMFSTLPYVLPILLPPITLKNWYESTSLLNSDLAPFSKLTFNMSQIAQQMSPYENPNFDNFIASNQTLMLFIVYVWLVGFLCSISYFTYTHYHLSEDIKEQATPNTTPHIDELVAQIGFSMKLKKRPVVKYMDSLSSPAVHGIIQPLLLLPTDIDSRLSVEELRLIVLHEFYHIKRKDLLLNLVATVLGCMNWFNPLYWYGCHLMLQDQEVACDEKVMKHQQGRHRELYGSLLINLVKRTSIKPAHIGLAPFLSRKKLIKRRISMISIYKNKRSISIMALAFIILFSAIAIPLSLSARPTTTPSRLYTDEVDLPFVNDPDIIGTWASVDFVREIDYFTPNQSKWKGDLYLTEMVFATDGVVASVSVMSSEEGVPTIKVYAPAPWFKWTKGVVTHANALTASAYQIKEIDGSTYLFLEWKSGDYTIRGMKPQYYVLKKIS